MLELTPRIYHSSHSLYTSCWKINAERRVTSFLLSLLLSPCLSPSVSSCIVKDTWEHRERILQPSTLTAKYAWCDVPHVKEMVEDSVLNLYSPSLSSFPHHSHRIESERKFWGSSSHITAYLLTQSPDPISNHLFPTPLKAFPILCNYSRMR